MKYDDIESPNIGERSNKTPSVKSSWGFHFRQVLKGGAALAALGLAALGGKLFYEFLGSRRSPSLGSKVEEVDETAVVVKTDGAVVNADQEFSRIQEAQPKLLLDFPTEITPVFDERKQMRFADAKSDFELKYPETKRASQGLPSDDLAFIGPIGSEVFTGRKLLSISDSTWIKTFGGTGEDWAHSVQQTTDGGYIVAGMTTGFFGGEDALVLKFDVNGDKVWVKAFGSSSGIDRFYSAQQTADGGYVVVGRTCNADAEFGKSDVLILKLSVSGNNIYAKTFSGTNFEEVYSVKQTTDGAYVMAGFTNSVGAGNDDVLVLKLDSYGNQVWVRTFGGASNERARIIQQTTDDGFIVAGVTASAGTGGNDFFVLKLDGFGNRVWAKTFGGAGDDYAFFVQQSTDDGYIIAGYTASVGAGGSDALVLKLDGSGNRVWAKTFGGIGDEWAMCIQQTTDDGYIVAGRTSSVGAGDYDILIFKLDSIGNKVWAKTFGGVGFEHAISIQQTADGGYIAVGETFSAGINGDTFILKLDANGNLKNGCWGQDVSWQTVNATLTEGAISWETQNATLTLASAESLVLSDWSPTVTTVCVETAPVVNATLQSQTGCCIGLIDQAYNFTFAINTFSDAEGDLLTYTATKVDGTALPIWLSFNPSTRTFSGTPMGAGDIGDLTLKVTATDPSGASVSDAFILKVIRPLIISEQWVKATGKANNYMRAYSVKQTTDAGYIVVGSENGDSNALILKLDDFGNTLWAKQITVAYSSACSVQQTADGGYIVAGKFLVDENNIFWDALILKLDSFGNKVWAKTFGANYVDWAWTVQQTVDGGYIVVGDDYGIASGRYVSSILKLNTDFHSLVNRHN